MKNNLNKNLIERYSRQIVLKNVGVVGQKKIHISKQEAEKFYKKSFLLYKIPASFQDATNEEMIRNTYSSLDETFSHTYFCMMTKFILAMVLDKAQIFTFILHSVTLSIKKY